MSHIHAEQFRLMCRRTTYTAFREVFHAHSQLELTYIHDGYGQLITEGHVFPLEPGMLMIFRPFQPHHVQIQVSKDHPFVRTVLMVELDLPHEYWPHFTATHHFTQHLLSEAALHTATLSLCQTLNWFNIWNISAYSIRTCYPTKPLKMPAFLYWMY